MIELAQTDALALWKTEIDLQISTAKSYPRSLAQFQQASTEMVTYSREAAEKLHYSLPRGGKMIEGPSVRFAEIIGQNWRNCRIGARVLGNDDKTVTSQGVFHDLETNVAISFEIKRRITRKDGSRYDDDMITMTGAAAAGIAFRNAVLKGIPKMFWQPLYDKALDTARGDDKDIAPRRKAALEYFAKMKVPEAAVLKTLGVTGISKIGPNELLTLNGIKNAIREGTTTPQEAFELGGIQPTREVRDESTGNVSKNAQADRPDASKGKKKAQPASNPAVPKAQIPKGPIPAAAPQNDPPISAAEQTKIYDVALATGWKIDEVRTFLKRQYHLDGVGRIRKSQLADILKAIESGT